MLTAILISVLTATDVSGELETSPVYLPRTFTLLTQFNQGAVYLSPRIAWEPLLVSQPRNDLVFVFELGPGFGVAAPTGYNKVWEHVAFAGLGLRLNLANGFRAGVSVGFGATLHGISGLDAGGGTFSEQRLDPYLEGRLQFGWQVGPIVLSLCGGWGGPPVYSSHVVSLLYAGGPYFGVTIDWKRPFQ